MNETVTGSGFSVPTFEDEPAKPRTRNPRKNTKQKAASKLIEAIDFVSLVSDPKSKRFEFHHARLVSGYAMAGNGMQRAGSPIEEDLTICPHLGMLADALKKAGSTLGLTVLDNGRLSIVSGPARFTVPCANPETIPPFHYSNSIAPLDDRVKAGFKALLRLVKDDAESVHEANLLLRANTVIGCNGALAMEYWHGNDLPPNLNIPQAFAKAVVATPKKLTGFGWQEEHSVTFHFEDGSWMATQLGYGQFPEAIDTVLNADCTLEDCPADLFLALDTIIEFSKDGAIHFHEDKLKTTFAAHIEEQQGSPYGASYEVEGLTGHHSFSGKLLKLAKPGCARIDYKTHDDRMVFYNQDEWLRGVIMKRIG